MDSVISSITGDLLAKAMDVCTSTHKVIANNIANINSDHFRASEVDFGAIFDATKTAVLDDDKAGISAALHTIDSNALPVRQSEGEPLSLDQSMVQLTENTLRYHALADMRKGMGSLMKIAITGSNR